MKKLFLSLLVATFHIAATILLYRERILHHRVESDVVLFLLPFIAASAGYYIVLTFKGSIRLRIVGLFGAPALAYFSLSAAMLYVLNIYGS